MATEPIKWHGHVICMMPAEDQMDEFQFPREGEPFLHMIWSDTPCWSTCWNGGNEYLKALRSENLEFVLLQHPWYENDAHFADIVLPVTSRFEVEDCAIDNQSGIQNTILHCEQCVDPVGEAKSDWECVQEVAKKLEALYGAEDEKYADLFHRYTDGRTVESSIELTFKNSSAQNYTSYEEFMDKGYAMIPHVENWQDDVADSTSSMPTPRRIRFPRLPARSKSTPPAWPRTSRTTRSARPTRTTSRPPSASTSTARTPRRRSTPTFWSPTTRAGACTPTSTTTRGCAR